MDINKCSNLFKYHMDSLFGRYISFSLFMPISSEIVHTYEVLS